MDFEYDFSSIGRILDRVQDTGLEVSADFFPDTTAPLRDRYCICNSRRIALGESIASAFTFRGVHGDLWSDRQAKLRYDRLQEIAKAAAKLRTLLFEDGEQAQWALSRHFSSSGERGELPAIVAGISKLHEAAEREGKQLELEGLHLMAPISHLMLLDGRNLRAETAADGFMISLGATFKEFFEDEPEIKQNSEREAKPGPFLAFVMAVRDEANEPVTPDAIRRAWDRARASQDKVSKT